MVHAQRAQADETTARRGRTSGAGRIRPYTGEWIDVTISSRNGRKRRHGIRLHRSSTLTADDIGAHRIPVTTIARTLLDVAATLREPSLARTVEQTEIRRLFDLRAVERTLARNPHSPRRRKAHTSARALPRREFTRSDLEPIFLALCAAHGIPRPLVNHIVEGEEADFFWPVQRVIVETDGRATHFTRSAYESDRARDARLLALGYRTMRVTERQIRLGSATVAQTLLAVLRAAAPTSASR
jgi:hypothetical protein